ncbi:hypothetical protein V6N11_009584 [Hibiscus sabdariffa]|uniref:SCP domain-containing protein n=1 Tax=Hibiscus sabdariffa TaxID=183260 RepID=A0ABR2P5T0_9ROSI
MAVGDTMVSDNPSGNPTDNVVSGNPSPNGVNPTVNGVNSAVDPAVHVVSGNPSSNGVNPTVNGVNFAVDPAVHVVSPSSSQSCLCSSKLFSIYYPTQPLVPLSQTYHQLAPSISVSQQHASHVSPMMVGIQSSPVSQQCSEVSSLGFADYCKSNSLYAPALKSRSSNMSSSLQQQMHASTHPQHDISPPASSQISASSQPQHVYDLCFSSRVQETREDILKAHNEFRAEVGVPPLVWNKTLAKYADKYARKRVKDCKMEHSMGPYGENLAGGYEDSTIADSVKFWATEKPDYDPATGNCKSGGFDCGHYTQIVARKTKSVGCAREKCKNGWYYVICSYFPIGNIEGEKAY